MAKIIEHGKTYNMSITEYYLQKKAEEIVHELTTNEELYNKVNELLRKYKLNKIKNGITNR